MSETPAKYRRVLLKLSGEALMGELDYGIEPVDADTPIFGLPSDGTLVNSIDYSFPNTTSAAEAILGVSAVFGGVDVLRARAQDLHSCGLQAQRQVERSLAA